MALYKITNKTLCLRQGKCWLRNMSRQRFFFSTEKGSHVLSNSLQKTQQQFACLQAQLSFPQQGHLQEIMTHFETTSIQVFAMKTKKHRWLHLKQGPFLHSETRPLLPLKKWLNNRASNPTGATCPGSSPGQVTSPEQC